MLCFVSFFYDRTSVVLRSRVVLGACVVLRARVVIDSRARVVIGVCVRVDLSRVVFSD